MAETTKIQWASSTWNPWIGCTKVSDACRFCYAEQWGRRWGFNFNKVQVSSRQTFIAPLKWRQKRIFVCSLSDFFHPEMWKKIEKGICILPPIAHGAIKIMINSDSNTWLILTKRPENIQPCLKTTPWAEKIPHNVWLGVTAENQEQADKRIPILLTAKCKTKFISCEPLLGPINLSKYLPHLSWVIVGGENAYRSKARPMASAWADDIYSQCKKAGVKFFFKQRGTAFLEENMECESIKEFPLGGNHT